MRYIGKLKTDDFVIVQARADKVEIWGIGRHLMDGAQHPVRVIVANSKGNSYFVECQIPQHMHQHHIHTGEVNITWEVPPTSLKETKPSRFKVTMANFVEADDTSITFKVVRTETVLANTFEEVISAPFSTSGYFLITNLEDKSKLFFDRIDGKELSNKKGKEIFVIKAAKEMNNNFCFTGHRPNKLPGGYDNLNHPGRVWIHEQIRAEIRQHIENYPEAQAIVGGALGIDQEAALICKEMGVPYHLYAPCREQDSKWPTTSKVKYQEMLAGAASVRYVHDGPYTKSCMQDRNKAMVNDSGFVIAIWDGSSGGTANCVAYAEKQPSIDIFIINPDEAPGVAEMGTPPSSSRFEDDDDEPVVKATLFFAGSCKFNPGPMGCGWVLKSGDKTIAEGSVGAGQGTNNQAAWLAAMGGLRKAATMSIDHLEVKGIAQIVLDQMNGEANINDALFRRLYNEALELYCHFRSIRFTKITKEENIYADMLSRKPIK
jgi:ribonuclease HI/uncharacterized phage-like protein YoqJ